MLGLAMVMAALGTGCAVDAADAELDQVGLDEAEEIDSITAALEEGEEEARGGFQAPGKDLLGPGKGGPDKGLIGAQGPVGQLGQAPVGQVGQAPVGQVGQAPIGQAPIGQAPIGQGPVGQGPVGQPVPAPVGAPGIGGFGAPGIGGFGAPGIGGFGAPGIGGFGVPAFGVSRFASGFGFTGFSPVTINNNNNNIVIALMDHFRDMHRDCPPQFWPHDLHSCHGASRVPAIPVGLAGPGSFGWGNRAPNGW
ncbi:hypothetical protein BE15_02415 [Sorangium cellulosum]|uniref:Uncharacterized protein n=2 Tax=Sorangium cellulosum TaxID=56 RepID=A0A150QP95_SORCE|nr:hypothetical protein BE15_02415 [Sorangium cellulosum]